MHTSRSNKKKIVITMGDPSGVGPEVTLKALASPKIKGLADFLLIGDRAALDRTAGDMALKFKCELLDLANVPAASFKYGVQSPVFGKAAIGYLDAAIRLLRKGEADALVTAPVNKMSIRMAGIKKFEGHTEYLAEKTGSKNFAMMFVGGRLKITLVTRHIALRRVPGSLAVEPICRTICITHKYLREYFNIKDPRIGVSGLNPHAGENGAFGDEEDKAIIPAIEKATAKVGRISGPIPADVIFADLMNGKYDAVVAMYHDQGLIPFKLLYFKDGVNLTIGLPFVRTSPDHGTAFDIAGKGTADPSSMIEAILLAYRLCTHNTFV